jgi:hypothetical protein
MDPMANDTSKVRGRAVGLISVFALTGAVASVGCTKTQAMTPETIDQQYGIAGAYAGDVQTPDGSIRGTIVPVTLADGRKAQLFVPQQARKDPHGVYLKDDQGLHPVHIKNNTTREEVTSAPTVVGTQPEPAHEQKRAWEKDALIIGGSAGAGTAIGAIAGGKKGAAVGAAAGGIGGLIYDLTTQHKD